jgi:hypothetical protein
LRRLAALWLAVAHALVLAAPAFSAPPSNNDFAGQTLTGASPVFTGTNADANGQVGEDDHAAGSRDSDWLRHDAGRVCG